MIDHPVQVDHLLGLIRAALPLPARMTPRLLAQLTEHTHRNTWHRNPHPAVGTLRRQAKACAEVLHAAAKGAKPSIGRACRILRGRYSACFASPALNVPQRYVVG